MCNLNEDKKRGTGPAQRLAQLVNHELREKYQSQNHSLRSLGELTGISHSRLAKALTQNKSALNINELGMICDALGVSVRSIVSAAEHAYNEEVRQLEEQGGDKKLLDEWAQRGLHL